MADTTLGVILLGDGLELHPVGIEDAEELFRAIERNRQRLSEWLPWACGDISLAATLRFLEEKVRENADRSSFTTVIRSQGRICGSIGLHVINVRDRSSSIGYWLDAEHEGRGIVTRACRAIVELGFRSYNLHRIEIRCGTGNSKSRSVPLHLGFTEEGVLREAEWISDHWVDLRVLSILETEWHG